MSCTEYVNTYTGCLVLCFSKLQTEITLSTTEAEYIALINKMHKVIPFMELTKEEYFILDIYLPNLEVFYKVLEYNQGCIVVTESKKLSPRTEYIAIKYHHF